jgi:hypothetical protein
MLIKAHSIVVDSMYDNRSTRYGYCSIDGWNDLVRFLVDHRASLEVADNFGATPLDAALDHMRDRGRGATVDVHEDTAALLERLIAAAGADAGTD